jgi:hypothetical protein
VPTTAPSVLTPTSSPTPARPASSSVVRRHDPRRGGKGGAHQYGGRSHDERGEPDAQHGGAEQSERLAAAGGLIRRRGERHQSEAEHREAGDGELEVGIERERLRMSLDAPTQQPAAQPEAAEKEGHRGARCGGRRAEEQPEQVHPGCLVDEGAEAGSREQERHPNERVHQGLDSHRKHARQGDSLNKPKRQRYDSTTGSPATIPPSP